MRFLLSHTSLVVVVVVVVLLMVCVCVWCGDEVFRCVVIDFVGGRFSRKSAKLRMDSELRFYKHARLHCFHLLSNSVW